MRGGLTGLSSGQGTRPNRRPDLAPGDQSCRQPRKTLGVPGAAFGQSVGVRASAVGPKPGPAARRLRRAMILKRSTRQRRDVAQGRCGQAVGGCAAPHWTQGVRKNTAGEQRGAAHQFGDPPVGSVAATLTFDLQPIACTST